MDNSIVIEPITNSVVIDSMISRVDVSLVKVESIQQFVTPVQVVIEKKEVV